MRVDAPVDICSQVDRLDRKLEQLLLCLAEHLADHEPASTGATAENAQNRPVDGAVGEGDLPHAHEGKRPLEGHGSFQRMVGLRVFRAPTESRGEHLSFTGKVDEIRHQMSDHQARIET